MHTIEHFRRNEYDHGWRCSCGATCPGVRTLQMAQDAATKHLNEVARVQKLLTRGRGEDLVSAHKHYAEMAANPNMPAKDRALWQQLADETGARLGISHTADEQSELFTL